MRSIQRVRVRVPTLAPGGKGWNKAALDLTTREVDGNAELTFPDYWNESDVRGALYAAQGRVCAYCSCSLLHNDPGDVDHFRPKSRLRDDPPHGGYWWLAYDFDNYLLSCRRCNSTYKSNQFPLRPRARRVTFQDRTRLLREARLLLDPARDPIEQWLRVDWRRDDLLCKILPAEGLPSTARVQVDHTLKFFRVNNNVRLMSERMEFRDLAVKDIDEGRTDEVRARAIRYRPHSLVAGQILMDRGERLPSPKEELLWLLEHLLAYFDLALEIFVELSPDEADEKLMNEVLWSLATLWLDPPGGMRVEVEMFLDQKEILGFVKRYACHMKTVRPRPKPRA